MAADWDAVATAINQRMKELAIDQMELIKRSRLAKQTVSEIQNNSKQRNRSPRTLEDMSAALDWHRGYLAAVLDGRIPPAPDEPHVRSADDIAGRLDVLEHRLNAMSDQVRKEVDASLDEHFAEFRKEMLVAIQQIAIRMRQTGR